MITNTTSISADNDGHRDAASHAINYHAVHRAYKGFKQQK